MASTGKRIVYTRSQLGLPSVRGGKGNRILIDVQADGCHHCVSHGALTGLPGDTCRYSSVGGKQLHRLIYAKHHGPIGEGLLIRHWCNNSRCVNPGHLKVGTYEDNLQDRRDRIAAERVSGLRPKHRAVRAPREQPITSAYPWEQLVEMDEIPSLPLVIIKGTNPIFWQLEVE